MNTAQLELCYYQILVIDDMVGRLYYLSVGFVEWLEKIHVDAVVTDIAQTGFPTNFQFGNQVQHAIGWVVLTEERIGKLVSGLSQFADAKW